MTVVVEKPVEQEMLADLAELRRLLNEHYIEEARRLAPVLAAKWPDSKELQHYAYVLPPGEVRVVPRHPKSRSLEPEFKWLKEHEYPGHCIALYGDRLIAASKNLEEVEAAIREVLGDEELPLMHFQPERW